VGGRTSSSSRWSWSGRRVGDATSRTGMPRLTRCKPDARVSDDWTSSGARNPVHRKS
jgi:hypothetical protein